MNMKIIWRLFIRMLVHPIFIIIYVASWYFLIYLCKYGNLSRNVPLLILCGVFYVAYLIYFILRCILYIRKSPKAQLTVTDIQDQQVYCKDAENACYTIPFGNVSQVQIHRRHIDLFLYGHIYMELDTKAMDSQDWEYLRMKLYGCGAFHRMVWKYPIIIILIITTILGPIQVLQTTTGFNSKLSWYLFEKNDKQQMTLKKNHTNIFNTGLDGLLEDIEANLRLPKTLSIAPSTGFEVHFSSDGTIQSIDGMLYGFDDNGDFVNSYLISYNKSQSKRISVYQNGTYTTPVYEASKDFNTLVEAIRVMDLKNTITSWYQPEYGILCYGVRDWAKTDTGLTYINDTGLTWTPTDSLYSSYTISEYTISVFCPQELSISPIRYLYQKNGVPDEIDSL